mgnify:CR=1 FL=1
MRSALEIFFGCVRVAVIAGLAGTFLKDSLTATLIAASVAMLKRQNSTAVRPSCAMTGVPTRAVVQMSSWVIGRNSAPFVGVARASSSGNRASDEVKRMKWFLVGAAAFARLAGVGLKVRLS